MRKKNSPTKYLQIIGLHEWQNVKRSFQQLALFLVQIANASQDRTDHLTATVEFYAFVFEFFFKMENFVDKRYDLDKTG